MLSNKMTSVPNMISLTSPGPNGTFKISVASDDTTFLATPVKSGKLMSTYSHACSNKEKKWMKMTSPKMTMKEKVG